MLRFRPHHFLCTLGFEGAGYSPGFIREVAKIVDRLSAPNGDSTPIQVTTLTDSICRACPHRRGVRCHNEASIQALDGAHAAVLKLHPGQVLTWGEAKELLRTEMTAEHFERACGGCAWKRLGKCEGALARLRDMKTTVAA